MPLFSLPTGCRTGAGRLPAEVTGIVVTNGALHDRVIDALIKAQQVCSTPIVMPLPPTTTFTPPAAAAGATTASMPTKIADLSSPSVYPELTGIVS